MLALLFLLATGRAPLLAGAHRGVAGAAAADLTDHAVGSAAAASDCPLPASAAGRCGTVAGFTGWYGSWNTAGPLGAYCLEHAKSEPRASLPFTHYGTAVGHTSMPAEDRARLGYLLGRYGGTTDATKAAALAILVHAAEGDSLTTAQLGSYPTTLPAAVRTQVQAFWAEAGDGHGPYTTSVAVAGSGSGAVATVTVRSASGHGVAGMPVSWAGSSHGQEQNTTDTSGRATLTVGTVAAGATVTAHAAVGGLAAADFAVWEPKDPSVQKVAVPLATSTALANGTWTAPAAPVTPVPPASPTPAPPVTPVTPVQPTPVPSAPATYGLHLRKTTLAGQPLAGAVLHLRGSSQPTSSQPPSTPGFDLDLGTCTSAADGSCDVAGAGSLPAGTYQVTEETPAPGTALADPSVQVVTLVDSDATVTFADPRLTTLGFLKTDAAPGSSVDHAHELLAGAVFAVSTPTGAAATAVEVARCVTATDGTCTLAGTPLVEGRAYTWAELVAPPGFALDPTVHPVTAAPCADTCAAQVLTQADQGRYAKISLVKHDAQHPDVPVAGAVFDLCEQGLDATLAGTYSHPLIAAPGPMTACPPGEREVARRVTGADGTADFGLLPPGGHYCVAEFRAPAGWLRSEVVSCADLLPVGNLADAAPAPIVFTVSDEAVTPPTAVPPTTGPPTTAPPTTTPPTAGPPSRAPVAPVVSSPPAVPSPASTPTPQAPSRPGTPPVEATPVAVSVPTSPVLAYTGASGVTGGLQLGLGLLFLGGCAVLAPVLLARRRTEAPQSAPTTARGGWIPNARPSSR